LIGGGSYERLCVRVAETAIETKSGPVSITVSIGVARGTGRTTADSLLAASDEALYQAKTGGRNRVAYAIQADAGDPARPPRKLT
jgi:eukaryotic-like serine/threonine-protein kinase